MPIPSGSSVRDRPSRSSKVGGRRGLNYRKWIPDRSSTITCWNVLLAECFRDGSPTCTPARTLEPFRARPARQSAAGVVGLDQREALAARPRFIGNVCWQTVLVQASRASNAARATAPSHGHSWLGVIAVAPTGLAAYQQHLPAIAIGTMSRLFH